MNSEIATNHRIKTPNPSTLNSQLSILNCHRAFTLVELLVVIAIIGVLATLTTVAVSAARQFVKAGIIRTEMGQIELALEKYKNEFGEYPPDFFDDTAVVRHVKKRWPRFVFPTPTPSLTGQPLIAFQAACIRQAMRNFYNSDDYNGKREEWGIGGGDPSNTDNPGKGNNLAVTFNEAFNSSDEDPSAPLASLAFWLGGFPNLEGRFQGFSSDPVAPFGRCYNVVNGFPNVNNPANWSTSTPHNINDGRNLGDGNITLVEPGLSSVFGVLLTPDKKVFCEMEVGKNVVFARKETAVKINITFPCLANQIGSDMFVPYVYFRAKSEGGTNAYVFYDVTTVGWLPKCVDFSLFSGTGWADIGCAVAYARSGGDPFDTSLSPRIQVTWYEPERYQLIHPGLDGKFGGIGSDSSPHTDPFNCNFFKTTNDSANDNNLGQQDMDNIVNFGGQGGTTIKSLLP